MTINDAANICYTTQPSTLRRTGEITVNNDIFDELCETLNREPTDEEMQEMADYYADKAERFAEASGDR